MATKHGGNRIILTEDGSHSIYNEKLNETYHSFHGAIQESKHVFIKAGLEYIHAQEKEVIRVFEVGFGTGLNMLLSAIWANTHKTKVKVDSIEAYPIDMSITNKLNYPALIGNEEAKSTFEFIHQCEWDKEALIHPNFHLTKIHAKLEEHKLTKNHYDIIFYDAFAPSKQPLMWALEMLKPVVDSLTEGGVFVTYCAQGQLKRNLKALGLEVETLSGPPGKKEMVRGVKNVKSNI